ncbi:MAG TPA: cation:proton antiporter [Streptosporangiaceae bacterium]|nr:cation:proton antiporter [Streptosporangiaceae bacterium]HLN71219.1 cation:proton antiporter [Streptosporangiaceae bacterium]
MTDQEVQLFLADLAIIILLARLFGMAAKRLGQPPVIGEIIAGILLGPTLFDGKITATLFPMTLRPTLSALANLGVVMFMFAVGYLLDLRLIRGRERVAASVSVSSIILPLSLGAGLGVWLAGRHHVHHVLPFALFVGTAMSVTAFPVLARILTDRGMHRTRIGGTALASAAIDDVLAWSLLAVVAAIAGAGGQPLRLLLAPVYAGVMFGLVRPRLRRLADVYQRRDGLTPNVLAVTLAGLLLSSWATDWMGVKYIFGAFLFGVVMPREGAAAAALREAILNRLEQVSVLVLLPVFFVVSGLSVNLSSVGLSGLAELCLILLVAVAGKFAGAFAGARLAGVPARPAGVLATLMNTRGLTGIVILSVGLQLHILDQSLYSLMIVMAIVTTMMAGPLLHFLYPGRFLVRDIAEADLAALGTAAGHRILVLIEAPEPAAPLVEVGAALAASREHSQLILSQLVTDQHDTRLEVGTGLGGELRGLTRSTGELQALADRAAARGVPEVVASRFSQDIATELPGYLTAAAPDTIVLGPGGTSREPLAAEGAVQLVTVLRSLPEAPAAVAVWWTPGPSGAAAVQVATQLAVADRLKLVISPAGGRRADLAAELTGDGIAASDGPPPAGAIVVAAAADSGGDAHLTVLAGSREDCSDLDQWVKDLNRRRLIGQR